MRKITSFFLLFLLGVWSSTMTAQTTSKTLVASDAPTESGWAANTTWYWIRNNNAGPCLSTGSGYVDDSGNLMINNRPIPEDDAALWCIVNVSETSDPVYQFYNKATGPNYILGMSGSEGSARAKMYDKSSVPSGVTTGFKIDDSSTSTTDVYSSTVYYRKRIRLNGSDNNAWNPRDNYLALWDHTDTSSDQGSGWQFVSYPTQFEITTNMDQPHWYYLTINTTVNSTTYDRYRLTYNGTTLSNKKNGSYNGSTETINFITPLNNLTQDLWCIKGNPFSGFIIRHYTGKVLTFPIGNTSGNVSMIDETDNSCDDMNYVKHWKFYNAGSNYLLSSDANYVFGLQHPAQTNYKINRGGANGNLVLWTGFDKGSTFRVFEPEFDVALNAATIDGANVSVATLALPYDFKAAASNTNTQIYWMNGQTNGYANLEAAESVAAGAGVILQNSAADTSVRMMATGGAPAFADNLLTGTTAEVSDLSGKLVFGHSATTGKVGFFTPSGTAPIPANRAYIETSKLSGASVQALYLSFDGTETGIEQIIPASEETPVIANAPVYDLSGRRVGQAVRGGVYIQNGKKFILK